MIKKNSKVAVLNQPSRLVIVALGLLVVCLGIGLVLTIQEKSSLVKRLNVFESCQVLNGGFRKEDDSLKTCVGYSKVKGINQGVKSFQDCEDDYFERTGVRRAVAASGSDDPSHSELLECELPDGRVMYSSDLGYFTAR